ncbi:hypothetical protein [Zobellia barbeyronii]|uniref:Uncharacterized protein n=1 Tax=Zobellia barbeyronii TaxID=2748009 RepID=A0ABS5WHA8_9FLAO|nr:hypothetical protein [Zobellia barbeyronii]MBT2162797.1 hypothetical protein [Zobellia barbeyronii]
MGVLNVTEYRVGTNRSRTNTNAHRFFLSLKGRSERGVVNSAIIYFWPSRPTDTVGYIAGSLFVGMLDDSDFQYWYDILRNEKPVKLNYVENSDASVNKVWHISIGTGDEGVGEGPKDFNN